jgi:hypothetical protein
MSELTVILKDSERTYRQKFIMYVAYSMSPDDPEIIKCIMEAKQNFVGEPEEVAIRTNMVIQ